MPNAPAPASPTLFARGARFLRRVAAKALRVRRLKRAGIEYLAPNYLFAPGRLGEAPVVVDCGCGSEAEFSIAMIERYGARAFAVDPTKKHHAALARLEERYAPNFRHVPLAVWHAEGVVSFGESVTNESGSILIDHANLLVDETVSYEVRAVTVAALLDRLDLPSCDFLKLDLEGAEYDLLRHASAGELRRVEQLFVEFHDHAVARYGVEDTLAVVEKVGAVGFQAWSLDDRTYLFLRLPGGARQG